MLTWTTSNCLVKRSRLHDTFGCTCRCQLRPAQPSAGRSLSARRASPSAWTTLARQPLPRPFTPTTASQRMPPSRQPSPSCERRAALAEHKAAAVDVSGLKWLWLIWLSYKASRGVSGRDARSPWRCFSHGASGLQLASVTGSGISICQR